MGGGTMKKKCEWCGRVLELDTFGMSCPHCKPFDDINELKQLVAKYRFALTKIAHLDFVITLSDRMDAVRAIAREALNN
jgi:hypothetical protein